MYDESNDKKDLEKPFRCELGYLFYVSLIYFKNFKTSYLIFILKWKDSSIKHEGPRRMTVILPCLDSDDKPNLIKPIIVRSSIKY